MGGKGNRKADFEKNDMDKITVLINTLLEKNIVNVQKKLESSTDRQNKMIEKIVKDNIENMNEIIKKQGEEISILNELIKELMNSSKMDREVPEYRDSYATKAATKKTSTYVIKRDEPVNMDDNQSKYVKEQVAVNKTNRPPKDPAENTKFITIAEKRDKVAQHMDVMARTMGVRITSAGNVKAALEKYKTYRQKKGEVYVQDKAIENVGHSFFHRFMVDSLHMDGESISKVKNNITKFTFETTDNFDKVYVEFDTIGTIAVVNSFLTNLNKKDINKVFPYVHKDIRSRYKAFETAAFKLRMDNKNIQTKIRPSQKDFMLLSRKKGSLTPWSAASQTFLPDDLDASFEVGKLNDADKITEKKWLKEQQNWKNQSIINQKSYVHKDNGEIPINMSYCEEDFNEEFVYDEEMNPSASSTHSYIDTDKADNNITTESNQGEKRKDISPIKVFKKKSKNDNSA